MPDFRQQIKDKMTKQGVSKMKLAAMAGLHYLTVCRYLAGADALESSVSDMIDALEQNEAGDFV